MQVLRDIPYGSHPSQGMDVYMPSSVGPNTNVFVYYHGGGWRTGSKDGEANLANGLNAMKDSGYDIENTIMVSVEYRKNGEPTAEYPNRSPDVTQADIMDDARQSFRAIIDLAEQHNVSTESLGIGGTSAGAWIASNLITNPEILGQEYHDKIDLAVLNAGVYDQNPYLDITEGEYAWVKEPALGDWFKDFVGGEINPEMNAIDNVGNIAGDDIKVIMTHGELDNLATVEQADAFHAGLLAQGIDVEYTVLENSGHALEEALQESAHEPGVYSLAPSSRTEPETNYRGLSLSSRASSSIRRLKATRNNASLVNRHKSNLEFDKASSRVILDDVRNTKRNLDEKKFLGRASRVKLEVANRVLPEALSKFNKASASLQNLRALSGQPTPGLDVLSAEQLSVRGLIRIAGYTRQDGVEIGDHYRKI